MGGLLKKFDSVIVALVPHDDFVGSAEECSVTEDVGDDCEQGRPDPFLEGFTRDGIKEERQDSKTWLESKSTKKRNDEVVRSQRAWKVRLWNSCGVLNEIGHSESKKDYEMPPTMSENPAHSAVESPLLSKTLLVALYVSHDWEKLRLSISTLLDKDRRAYLLSLQ